MNHAPGWITDPRKHCPLIGFVLQLLFSLSQHAIADGATHNWPTQPIRLIVPYATGGSSDVLSRKVAELLKDQLGTIVVVNRPGAGSTLATSRLARGDAFADHAILMASTGHAIGAAIYPNLRYDPVEDFEFLSTLITVPNVMVVPAKSPYTTVSEFVQAARQQSLAFSSPGFGSGIHMSAELFKTQAGVPMIHVPYRGSGEALPALLSGDVDVAFENLTTVLPHIRSGGLRALAVTSSNRSDYLPDIPTIAEAGADDGLSEYRFDVWFGLIAHKSTPPQAVQSLRRAIRSLLKNPEFVSFLANLGAEPSGLEGAEFSALVAREVTRWVGVVRDAGSD